jgi:hypothetical protein
LVAFAAPCSSPRPCPNRSPSAIPTTVFAFVVGVHHPGGFERASAKEHSVAYNHTVLNSRCDQARRRFAGSVDGPFAQVGHPSTQLTAFENRQLRFRRSLAFAHASAVISDKTRPVRERQKPLGVPLEARASQGITGVNPLFDTPAKTVNINNNQSVMHFGDGLLCESPIPKVKLRPRAV